MIFQNKLDTDRSSIVHAVVLICLWMALDEGPRPSKIKHVVHQGVDDGVAAQTLMYSLRDRLAASDIIHDESKGSVILASSPTRSGHLFRTIP